MAPTNTGTGFHLDLQNFEVRDVDFYGSIQERLERYGEQWSTFTQALWGKAFSNFLDSTPANDRMDESWQPVRALGKGAFGMVGLWEKRNRKGKIMDSIAIKEMKRDLTRDTHLRRDPTLAREAVMMHQLQGAERGRGWQTKNNILRLRSFKFFPGMNKWRFYLEFAEHGDFYKLMHSYRVWDTYLPEEFLWHTFHSFAKVALVMEQGPFIHPELLEPNNGPVLHLDIKPENIFLGKPDKKALFAKYPTIKVADFGLSEMTHKDDPDNPMLYRKGTLDHMAREMTCFTAHWKRRPDGIQHDLTQYDADAAINIERGMREPGYKYLAAHNVWGFGKLMYDMITLSWSFELDEKMYKSTTEAEYYGSLNEHAIPEITTNQDPEYSSSLRNLIRECLHIDIGKRPTPQQLLERTQRGLETAAQSRQQDADERDGPRVYHMGNEINHMPRGHAGLPVRRSDWKAIREQFWMDPHWQPLLSGRWAPQVRSGELVNQPIEEGGPKRPVRQFHGSVQADPRPIDNFQNHRGVIWTIRSLSAERDVPSDHEESDDDDQRKLEHQYNLGENRPTPRPHDTGEHSPRPNDGDAARPSDAPDDTPTSLERATQLLADAAREMAHPRNVSSRPVQRLKINPPKAPTKKQIQPKQTKKRKRVMGISVDDIAEELQGRNVEGHNLRSRRRR